MTIYKIYKITNRLNGKVYIGQTIQPIEKRFMQHSKANSPLADSAGTTPPAKITSDVAPITNERLAKLEERIERYDSWFKRKGFEL